MQTVAMTAALLLSGPLAMTAIGAPFVLVEKGASRAPIVVAESAPPATRQAVGELVRYLGKISGAKVPVIYGAPDPVPKQALWVGPHPMLQALLPTVNLQFEHPEEILLTCTGDHLLVIGRDRVVGDTQTEHGTANAVFTFLEKRLDVRWLWPNELGEDIIKRDTIAFAPFEYRHHPVFRQRHFWPRSPRDWHRHQRLYYYSYTFKGGHGFTDWWDRYHEAHPEYFALLRNGRRGPARDPHQVKLCLANPEVWAQWLENAEQKLRADPALLMVSASPNDGAHHCTCARCRAWDPPRQTATGAAARDEEPELGNAPSLTDRHVRFWNILARGLRQRFPDREAYVAAMAYGAYFAPPRVEKLEKNIAIAQVGYFPLTSDAAREQQKTQWRQWADKATLMSYRPNLWYWAGGVWSLPEVAMTKTIEDFRFLAENKCIGIIVDVMRHHWATQGPQYYLMAQLAYDPFQDGAAVLKDYYRRGFGKGAEHIERYWTIMEEARDAFVADPEFRMGSANRYNLPPLLHKIYSGPRLARADTVLREAERQVADGPELYRERVAFVRAGLDFTRILIDTIPVMTRIRKHGDPEAIQLATANWNTMERIAKEAPTYAILFKNLVRHIGGKAYMGGMADYLGPPSAELQRAAQQGAIQFAAPKWQLKWSDNFDRAELGDGWKVQSGHWHIVDGQLVSDGGALVSTRLFPGLQKIEFRASATPNPRISDMSPVIHCGPSGHASGYLMQFGGYYNSRNSIQRQGRLLLEDKTVKIEPERTYVIVAEYDGGTLRLAVDGRPLLQQQEQQPLVGTGHEQIGFYVHEGIVRIDEVRVYSSPAVRVTRAE